MKRAVKYALPLAAVATAGLDDTAIAGDIFLKMDPIQGESQEKGHADEIDVLAWSWGVSKTPPPPGGGGGGSAPSFSDIKVIKSFDIASPALLLGVADGTHFGEAVLSMNRNLKSGEPVEYLNITLTNVLVSKMANGGKDGEAGVSETVTLNYGKLEFTYKQLDSEGEQTGESQGCWDLTNGKAC